MTSSDADSHQVRVDVLGKYFSGVYRFLANAFGEGPAQEVLAEQQNACQKRFNCEVSFDGENLQLFGTDAQTKEKIIEALYSAVIGVYERRESADRVWGDLHLEVIDFYKEHSIAIRKNDLEFPTYKHTVKYLAYERLLDLFSVKSVVGKEWTQGVATLTSQNLVLPAKKREIRIPLRSISVPLRRIISLDREVYLSVDAKNMFDSLWVLDYRNRKNQLCSVLVTGEKPILDVFKHNVAWIRKEIGKLLPQEQALLSLLNNHLPESTLQSALNLSREELAAMLARLQELGYVTDRNQLTASGMTHLEDAQ